MERGRNFYCKIILFYIFCLFSLTFAQPLENFFFSLSSTTRPHVNEAVDKDTSQPLVDNVFVDTDIREVLREIGSACGVQILIDNTVQGTVSIDLKKVPLEEALRMVLSPGGYVFKKKNGYYIVGSPDRRSPFFFEFTKTEPVRLEHLKAEDVPKLLPEAYKKYICVNKEKNILTITAPEAMLSIIKEKIKSIDKAKPQVLIEVLVAELSKDARTALGIKWEGGALGASAGLDIKVDPPLFFFSYQMGRLTFPELLVELEALSRKGKARIRATPTITTLDGEQAVIYVEVEEYHRILTGPKAYPYMRLEAIKSGIRLRVTPYVGKDCITLELSPEVADITRRGPHELPEVVRRGVTTKVRVKTGRTIAVGGLKMSYTKESIKRFPILGHIPILGLLFSYRKKQELESELCIFITPKVL
jgi:type IV pilus assembly protein PilQ